MSDRNVQFVISAKDDASAKFDRAASSFKRMRAEISRPATYDLAGDLYQLKRSPEEQASRAAIATRLRAARSGDGGGGGLSARDFGRVDRLARVPAGLQNVEEKSLAQQSRGLQRAFGLFGGVAIADQVGASMQKLPEALDDYYKHIREGSSKTEAFGQALAETIPGAGQLAKGLNAGYSFLHDLLNPNQAAERRRTEEQQDLREERDKLQDKNNARRQPIMLAMKAAAEDASDALKVAGLTGTAREGAQIRADYEKRLRELQSQYDAGHGQLSPDQLDAYNRQFGLAKAAARAERDDKIAALDRDRMKRTQEEAKQDARWNEEADDQILKHRQEGQRADLEMSGRFYDAKLDGLRNSTDEAIRQLEREKRAEIEALAADYAAGKTASFVTDDAERRFQAKRTAVVERASKDRQEIELKNQRELADVDRDFITRRYDLEGNLQARRLQLGGKTLAAEKLENLVKYRDTLAEIRKDEEEQLRTHAEDADAIKRKAAVLSDLAGEDFALSEQEILARRASSFRPDVAALNVGDTAGLTGTGGNNPVIDQNNLLKTQLDLAKKQTDIQQRQLDAIQELLTTIKNGKSLDVVPPP